MMKIDPEKFALAVVSSYKPQIIDKDDYIKEQLVMYKKAYQKAKDDDFPTKQENKEINDHFKSSDFGF